jgi:hypothetical protein
MGTCLLSNAGYCHIRSLDLDPCYFQEFRQPHQLEISGLSSLSDLLDTRIGVFDTGNSYLAGESPYGFLEAVKDKVIHMHAEDISVAQSDAERGHVEGTAAGCACGSGVIDWRRVAAILRTVDYHGVLSVECGTEQQAADSVKHLQAVLAT